MDVGAFRVTSDNAFRKVEAVKQPVYTIHMVHHQKPIEKSCDPPVKAPKFWDQPTFNIFWWLFTWPIRIALAIAIPKARMERRIYLATFLMSMLVLAFTSYIIFWMISIIGYTFGIPESIMGMTLLAAGGCLPEANCYFIMARKGNGDIGVSNSLGANSLAILFSLGIPWFLKIMVRGGPFTNAFINIQSDGMEYVVISLIAAVVTLYLVLRISGYNLRKTVGVVLFVAYTIFVAFPILVEMNVLLPNDNNKC
jgi:Ca2+/Na+ antiporter